MIRLIKFSIEYLPLVTQWINDPILNQKIGGEGVLTPNEVRELVTGWAKDKARIYFMVEHRGEVIGQVMLSNINHQHGIAELHTLIGDKRYLGKRPCIETWDAIFEHAFHTLNLHRVYGSVIGNNHKLLKTVKKYGYTEEGVLKEAILLNGNREDIHLVRMLKTEFKKRSVRCLR